MPLFQAIVLGIVQGLTEFLPVSSSAHLYLIPRLLHWPYAGLAFDVALHWGTLIALLVAFGRTWIDLTAGLARGSPEARSRVRSTWLKLIAASVPAAIAGVVLKDAAETWLRNLPLQAAMLAGFGFLLWWVDRTRPAGTDGGIPGWGACITMGFAQALALVPGVSRSGVTITAGRAAGLERVSAARFSFLLATPITFGAGLIELRHLPHDLPAPAIAAGVASSAIVGLLAIRGLLRWLRGTGFAGFFAYRAAFALLILFSLARR
ncbi:MAG: undecaprenyl-diphosphate phosphatase [Candidatus Eisenbacteria bacterium]|nr:undecaprenyl-diphosphate phosphatase [Candidatus Eisenbacteria bacterium]